jgi:release factor glutamine methyltransferase
VLGLTNESRTSDSAMVSSQDSYDAYFGLGHSLRLLDRPGVFRVSPAGLRLGDLLVRHVEVPADDGWALDMGTGSGVQALLLRSIGARNIVATDISEPSVKIAGENEILNFGDQAVTFEVGSLFDAPSADRAFDLIVFNPPGWRTPSPDCQEGLERLGLTGLGPEAMFSGDRVLTEFLGRLPDHLTGSGRAIAGFNSMVGIQRVLADVRKQFGANYPLKFRLLERHTFPLFVYTEKWRASMGMLRAEFQLWKDHYGSAFSVHADGTLYFSYELVECRVSRSARATR